MTYIKKKYLINPDMHMPRDYMPVFFAITPVASQNNSLSSEDLRKGFDAAAKSFLKDHIMYNFIQYFSS